MNSVQMHLALTHVPVILSLVALVMLITTFLTKSSALVKTTYVIILLAGVAAIPVFLSGEGTEEAVEHLPGVSESVIQRHEELAQLAMISVAIAGGLAMIGLFLYKFALVARLSKVFILLLALTSAILMAQTAHLGGQIRHTEIRNGVAAQNANEIRDKNDD